MDVKKTPYDFLDILPTGVAVFEYGEPILLCRASEEFLSTVGYSESEYAEICRCGINTTIYHEDVAILTDALNRIKAGEKGENYELRLIKKNGALVWVRFKSRVYQEDEKKYIVVLAENIDSEKLSETEIAIRGEQLKYRAERDILTGAYSRESFFDCVERQVRDGDNYVIIQFNIDKFKLVNELFGESVGNRALIGLSDVVEKLSCRGVYGRLIADRFACLLRRADYNSTKIIDSLESIPQKLGINYNIIINFGVYEIDDASISARSMCDRANMALLSLNGDLTRRYAIYDEHMRNTLIREQELTSAMESALSNGEFEVYYQPIFSVASSVPISAEALVRWNKDGKVVSPGEFIPLFERNSFISKLDYYVWREVAKYIADRKRRHKPSLPISVNVSRVHLYNPNLAKDILSIINAYGVEPPMFKLEITESAYMDNPDLIKNAVVALKKAGFIILMDDFGSGYSALNTLKDMPVDLLKIDMRFLGGLSESEKARNILTSIVRMARWLSIPVIVEGVETKEEVEFLSSIGCDFIQGYFYSKPLPRAEFDKMTIKVQSVVINDEVIESVEKFDEVFNGESVSSRLFRTIVGAVGVYEYDGKELEVVRVSDRYFEMIGVTPQQFYDEPKNVFEKVHKDDLRNFIEACDSVASKRTRVNCIVRRKREDESYSWFEINIRYFGERNGITLLCLVLNDVSESKEHERRIIEKNAELVELYNTVPCAIIQYESVDPPIIRNFNDTAWKTLGYSSREHMTSFCSSNFYADIYEEDREYVADLLKNRVKADKYTPFEHRYVKIDGSMIYVRGTLNLIEINGVKFVQSVFTDVTEMKKIEYESFEKQRELNRHQEYYSDMLNKLPYGLMQFTIEEGKYKSVFFNDISAKIMGYSSTEALKTVAESDYHALIHPDERIELDYDLNKLLTDDVKITFEHRSFKADGSVIFLRSIFQMVDTFHGKRVYQDTFYDISEEKRKERGKTLTKYVSMLYSLYEDIYEFDFKANTCKTIYSKNASLGRLFESAPLDIMLKKWQAAILPEYVDNYQELTDAVALKKATESGRTASISYRIKNKSGEVSCMIANVICVSGDVYVCCQKNVNEEHRSVRSLTESAETDARVKDKAQKKEVIQSQEENFASDRDSDRFMLAADEMYKIFMEDSRMLIFDYDKYSDSFSCSFVNADGKRARIIINDCLSEKLFSSKVIADDFKKQVAKLLTYAPAEGVNYTYDFMADLVGNGVMRWYRAKYKGIYDSNGKFIRIIGRAYDIQEERENINRLSEIAELDSLSGLYNRTSFEKRVNQQLKKADEYVFVMIDLDKFKNINDKYGHPVGDEAIIETARILRATYSKCDAIFGRLGGDEFAVFYKSQSDVEELASKLNEQAMDSRLSEEDLKLSFSIGAILSRAGDDFKSLFSAVDKALYNSKGFGGGSYTFISDRDA